MSKTSWNAYCLYLKDWADSHADAGFEGYCPSCYEEFLDNDYESEGEAKPWPAKPSGICAWKSVCAQCTMRTFAIH